MMTNELAATFNKEAEIVRKAVAYGVLNVDDAKTELRKILYDLIEERLMWLQTYMRATAQKDRVEGSL